MTPIDVIMELDVADPWSVLMEIDLDEVEDFSLREAIRVAQIHIDMAYQRVVERAEVAHYDWTEEKRYL